MKQNKYDKKVSFIVRIILFMIISVVLGFSIYSINAKSISGNMLPMPFNIGSAIVLSGSMEPELSVDDLIIVSGKKEYFVDDIVVFQDKNSLVVHRIIDIEGDVVITQGDANNTADSPITIKDIKGKVVCTIPKIGVIVSAIKSPLGVMCILGIAVILLLMSYQKEKEAETLKINKIKEEIKKIKESN